MTRLTVAGRVAVAREILQGVDDHEYAALSAESKTDLQEAMVFLHDAERRLDGVSEK